MNQTEKRCLLIILALAAALAPGPAGRAAATVPVIYCTDLFHPHEDPDDHFDIACLYAMPEVDIKAVILDQGRRQQARPGAIPLTQLNSLTGQHVPFAPGLADKLLSPDDDGSHQPPEYQAGITLIQTTLEAARQPLTIITVGSLRDVAATLNRRPDLFKAKVARLFIFIGEASAPDHVEYNVRLDPHAFARIMNSGLPNYWVPCFDGGPWQNHGKASYWKAPHAALLRLASDRVVNYFVYALLHKQTNDPPAFLNADVNEAEKAKLFAMPRNLWCAAVFPHVADRTYVRRQGTYLSLPAGAPSEPHDMIKPFEFVPVSVFVDADAKVFYENTPRANTIHQFHVLHPHTYAEVMTSVTARLLEELDADRP